MSNQSGNYPGYDNDHIQDASPDGSMLSDKHEEYNRRSKKFITSIKLNY